VRSQPKIWACWAAACVFCLFFFSYAQNESRIAGALNSPESVSKDFSLYDFAAYYVAGKITRDEKFPLLYYPVDGSRYTNPTGRHVDPATHWASVGRTQGFDVTQHYIYPPLFALLISPLTRLAPPAAYILWRQINLGFLLLAVFFALKCAEEEFSWPIFLIAAIATFSFFPYHETAYMGQVGGLILLLWTLGVYFLSKSNPVWSAGCFALGTIIKLTPVLVVPLLLLRRQWKWLAAYAGWMAFFLGISLWRFGWQNHVIYFAKVLPTMSCGYPLATNVSLATVLQSLHAGGALLSDELVMQAQQNMPVWVCLLAKVIGLGIYLGTLLLFWKNKDSQRGLVEELAILTLVSVLVSPVAWRHSYVVTLLPILLIWMGARRQVFSTGKYMLLFLATITIGTAIPYYLLIHLKRSVLDVALVGAVPAAAIILLLICLQLHTRNATIEIS
jgi:hypothetical protein